MKKLISLITLLAFALIPIQAIPAPPLSTLQQVAAGAVTQANMKISAVDGGATASGGAFIDFTDTLASQVIPGGTAIKSGVVTQANMKLSAAAGAAFCDFAGGANDVTTLLNNKIVIRDSAGRRLVGYIKAAGTSETPTALTFTSWVNGSTYAYETWGSSGADITSAINTTGFGGCASDALGSLTVALSLYKLDINLTLNSGTGLSAGVVNSQIGAATRNTPFNAAIVNGANSIYATCSTVPNPGYLQLGVSSGVAINFSATGITLSKITTPSSTGVTISSTYNGTAMDNWTSTDTGFNYNDTAGYTYAVYSPNPLPSYIGHRLHVRDSVGHEIIGYIKAAGTGAEGLSSSLNTSTCVNSGVHPYETFDGASASGFHASNTTAYGVAGTVDEIPFINGGLFKVGFTFTLTSGSYPLFKIQVAFADASIIGTVDYPVTAGANSFYRTVNQTTTGVWDLQTNTGYVNEFTVASLSIQQVTTPSSTGTTIVSTKGGATYNYTVKNSTFNYNDPSGYTYAIYKDNAAVVVKSSTYAAGASHLSLVDGGATASGGAFADLTGAALIDSLQTAKSVTGITKANPGVVTLAAGHGYVNGDIIYLSGLTEMTELNGTYQRLRSNSGDTFQLAVIYDTSSLDTSAYGAAETTGGNCAQKANHYGDGRHLLAVYDSSGRAAIGYIKSVGGGESLATNIFATFNFTLPWPKSGDATIVDADSFSGSSSNAFIYKANSVTIGRLYKQSLTGTSTTGTPFLTLDFTGWTARVNLNGTSTYYTAKSVHTLIVGGSSAGQTDVTTIGVEQVLTPSATGVVITNTKGGVTYNWLVKDPAFDPNSAGTYKIYFLGD